MTKVAAKDGDVFVCTKCGYNAGTAKFCPKCGNPLNPQPVQETPVQNEPVAQTVQSEPVEQQQFGTQPQFNETVQQQFGTQPQSGAVPPVNADVPRILVVWRYGDWVTEHRQPGN